MGESLSGKIQSIVSPPNDNGLVSSAGLPEKMMNPTCIDLQISEIVPDNSNLEEMLRKQLASLNILATRFIIRAETCSAFSHQIDIADKYAKTSIRLVNAIRAGIETLARIQNKGKQQIVVQHIHVANDGKAMIAGSINKTGGGYPDNTNRGLNNV